MCFSSILLTYGLPVFELALTSLGDIHVLRNLGRFFLKLPFRSFGALLTLFLHGLHFFPLKFLLLPGCKKYCLFLEGIIKKKSNHTKHKRIFVALGRELIADNKQSVAILLAQANFHPNSWAIPHPELSQDGPHPH